MVCSQASVIAAIHIEVTDVKINAVLHCDCLVLSVSNTKNCVARGLSARQIT